MAERFFHDEPVPFHRPDPAAFADPREDPVLADYLAKVVEWHGHLHFLGLAHLRANADIRIDRLYVEPNFAPRHVAVDDPPDTWKDIIPSIRAMAEHPRLVVLGDPGSGKSTLVSWLAWELAWRDRVEWLPALLADPETGEPPETVERLLPIPMIVREMDITRKTDTWQALLDVFLARPVAEPLGGPLGGGKVLEPYLDRGQAVILIDGLDEIGSVEVRRALRTAVHDGMRRWPKCRWVMTSRIVGYDEVDFCVEPLSAKDFGKRPSRIILDVPDATPVRMHHAVSMYVAPFDDGQIDAFCRNWFAARESVSAKADEGAANLIRAIRDHESIENIARIPNLLTMVALVHRVYAQLPDGRTHLYAKITEAYLESIDRFRGIHQAPYPLQQKRRWLARVGFEMQRRRADRGEQNDTERGILASADDVLGWVQLAMSESGFGADEEAARAFVDYIGRRSGLLLPRGEGRLAFLHLSFQEYFAACFLQEQVSGPLWAGGGEAVVGAGPEDLHDYARRKLWHESLIFLFEMMADQPGWPPVLAKVFFGENFDDIVPEEIEVGDYDDSSELPPETAAGVLAVHLAADPYSGFTPEMQSRAVAQCCRLEAAQQKAYGDLGTWWGHAPHVARALLAAQRRGLHQVWGDLVAAFEEASVSALNLDGAAVTELSPLAGLKNLQYLYLRGTAVSDVSPLAGLKNLRNLDLDGTAVSDVSPLAGLKNLDVVGLQEK